MAIYSAKYLYKLEAETAHKDKVRQLTRKALAGNYGKCFLCGGEATEFHHIDYDENNPMDGFAVCASCHFKWHHIKMTED
jgi:DNA-directed RNA polymerase subunit M/transcription elongation factor TFIIS